MTNARRTVNRLGRATVSAGGLAALLAGLPWALLATTGNPLLGLPRLTQTWISGMAIQHLIALFVWLLWAIFVAALGVEATAVMRGTNAPQLKLLSPAQGLATLLVAGLLSAPVASAAAVSASIPRPAAAAAVVTHTPAGAHAVAQATVERTAADVVTVRVADQHYTYRVHRGDTLWHIADTWLGSPLRWHEIYHLNQAHYDQHGRMRHGNLILPGWVLALPADATAPPTAAPTPAPPVTTPPSAAATPAPTPAPSETPSNPTPSPAATGQPTLSHSPQPPTRATSKHPAPTHTPAAAHPTTPAGINLSGGDWLDTGLAAVLVAGAALVWAHRRRRYLPRPPSADMRLSDPDLAPLPDAVHRSRRAVAPRHDDDTEPIAVIAASDLGPGPDPDFDDTDLLVTADRAAGDPDEAASPAPIPAVVLPSLANPVSVVWPSAGLGLTGPGAEHAARGFLVTALADTRGDEPDARPLIVIPSGTLATLLGAGAVMLGDSPRLHITAGLSEALVWLEQATLTRSRMVYDSEADDVTGLREHDSLADPVPPVLLIADATARHERTRIASVLTQGQRLDIHGVLLGDWPDGDTVAVAADGATTPADSRARHGGHPAGIGRLTVLGAAQAAELMRTAIEADTGRAQPAPPIVRKVADTTGAAETRPATDSISADVAAAVTPDITADHSDQTTATASATEPDIAELDGSDIEASDAQPSAGEPAADPGADHATTPVVAQIRVLGGTPQIAGLPPDSKDKPPLRVKSREMLAYLMAHPRGATEEALYDDVLADLKASRAAAMLNTYVYNLRRNLRAVAGPGEYVLRPKNTQRCDLEPGRFDCDLWRMHQHLHDAEHARDPAARIAALQAAIAEYGGPFAETHGYEWVEPVREAIRRQAIDAHARLAELLAPTDRAGALAILDQAIAQDHYNEALYQQAMRLHAAAGDADAIRRLLHDLTEQLAGIPAEPSDDTLALADQLTSEINRSRRSGT